MVAYIKVVLSLISKSHETITFSGAAPQIPFFPFFINAHRISVILNITRVAHIWI